MSTTTITLTPEIAQGLTIPATEELLRGWAGPCSVYNSLLRASDTGIVRHIFRSALGETIVEWVPDWASEPRYTQTEIGRAALPLSRPEVRDRVLRVMAEGVRCPASARSEACAEGAATYACHLCGGAGYLRPPANLSAFRDGPNLTAPRWTPPDLSAALLHLCVVRMAAGMGPIVDCLLPWDVFSIGPGEPTYQRMSATRGYTVVSRAHAPRDAQTLDAINLARGYALLQADGTLTAEIPETKP